jgi:hypothetical protein
MTLYSLLCTLLGSAILSGAGFLSDSPFLGIAGIILIGLNIVLIGWDAGDRIRNISLLLGAILALIEVLYGGRTILLGAGLTLILIGWEFSHAARMIAPFSEKARSRFAKKHLWQMLLLGTIGVLLAALALQVHMRLNFRLALSLGLGILVLLALLLRSIAQPKTKGPASQG